MEWSWFGFLWFNPVKGKDDERNKVRSLIFGRRWNMQSSEIRKYRENMNLKSEISKYYTWFQGYINRLYRVIASKVETRKCLWSFARIKSFGCGKKQFSAGLCSSLWIDGSVQCAKMSKPTSTLDFWCSYTLIFLLSSFIPPHQLVIDMRFLQWLEKLVLHKFTIGGFGMEIIIVLLVSSGIAKEYLWCC